MDEPVSTGASTSKPKLSIDDLGPIHNQLERLDIEKLVVKSLTWAEVVEALIQTKMHQRISGNTIGRILLMLWLEEKNDGRQAPKHQNPFPPRSGPRTSRL